MTKERGDLNSTAISETCKSGLWFPGLHAQRAHWGTAREGRAANTGEHLS